MDYIPLFLTCHINNTTIFILVLENIDHGSWIIQIEKYSDLNLIFSPLIPSSPFKNSFFSSSSNSLDEFSLEIYKINQNIIETLQKSIFQRSQHHSVQHYKNPHPLVRKKDGPTLQKRSSSSMAAYHVPSSDESPKKQNILPRSSKSFSSQSDFMSDAPMDIKQDKKEPLPNFHVKLEQKTCLSCFVSPKEREIISLQCGHSFCNPCLQKQKQFICPFHNCNADISYLFGVQKTPKRSTNTPNYYQTPTLPTYSPKNTNPPQQILEKKCPVCSATFSHKEEPYLFGCLRCEKIFCLKCGKLSHPGEICS